ncbi:hypothetical protein ACOHYD_13495 [Desulfobacterota bacterium M19]
MGKATYWNHTFIASIFISFFIGLAPCWGKSMYATERCQTYNGPSKSSGKFFYSSSAQAALTLDERQQYEITKEQGGWVQVDVFGKRPWVEKKCMTNQLTYNKNTLKKNALVCRTKEQFNEFVQNRNDKGYTMNMLADGKCLFNITNAEVHAEVLEGIFPKVKVKVYWGDEIFVGWTETTMVNE